MVLLQTKHFIPVEHPESIERPKLYGQLEQGLITKLTTLSAPPGFGKTSLLSSWIRRRQIPAAWISLDDRDNQETGFWAYFASALQKIKPGTADTALAMLQGSAQVPIENVIIELLNGTAEAEHDFVLVFDDYHVITSPAIHESMRFLLDHLPPKMHLYISSRTDPPFPLPLMRVRKTVTEIRPDDLRFSIEETSSLLNDVLKIPLQPEEIQRIDSVTEGWIAGLQMVCLAIRETGQARTILSSFSGEHRYIFDYLAQEVFEHQDDTVKQFLVSSSLFEQFTGELCDAALEGNGSPELIEQLFSQNLFLIPLDSSRKWFRYHHLFADYLRVQREKSTAAAEFSAKRQNTILRRAADWFAEHEYFIDAVRYAFQADDPERAAEILNECAEMLFYESKIVTLLELLTQLPAEMIKKNIRLNIIFAWALIATNRFQEADGYLMNVADLTGHSRDAALETLKLPETEAGGIAAMLILKSSIMLNQGDFTGAMESSSTAVSLLERGKIAPPFATAEALKNSAVFNIAIAYEFQGKTAEAADFFRQALKQSTYWGEPHLPPMILSHLAQINIAEGKLTKAQEICKQALSFIEQKKQSSGIPASPLSGMVFTGLGTICIERGELAAADEYISRGVARGRKWYNWETLLPGYLGLCRMEMIRGNAERALETLEDLKGFIRDRDNSFFTFYLDLQSAVIRAAAGGSPVFKPAETALAAFSSSVPYLREAEAVLLSHYLLLRERYEDAGRLLTLIERTVREGARFGRLIEVLTLQAMLAQKTGDRQNAIRYLEEALALGEGEQYRMVFLEKGPPVEDLLKDLSGSSGYASELLGREPAAVPEPTSGKGSTGGMIPEGDRLSSREVEVLRLIAGGCRNQEAADKLFVSLNTVKTHLKNIYVKLNAKSRTDAAAKAREQGYPV